MPDFIHENMTLKPSKIIPSIKNDKKLKAPEINAWTKIRIPIISIQ